MSESVPKVKFYPQISKINSYLNSWQVKQLEKLGYVELELIMPLVQYEKLCKKVSMAIVKHGLLEQKEELLYLIFREDENLEELTYLDRLRFEDTQKAIDVSKFLLGFKNAINNPLFQIGIKENVGTIYKPKTNSYFIENEEISKWMCQLILDAIENGQYPEHMFGTTFTESIAGLKLNSEKHSIDIKSLEYGLNLKNKSYNVLRKRRYAQFCLAIKKFLEAHTTLETPKDVKLTDAQANLLFDILVALSYIDKDKIESEPKDYVHSLIRNYSK